VNESGQAARRKTRTDSNLVCDRAFTRGGDIAAAVRGIKAGARISAA
jgi:hypothetical protein